jgi:hypothetical protein
MPRHVISFVTAAVIVCGALTVSACSRESSSATAPLQPGAITGSWSGALTDAIVGSGTLSLNLNQFGDSVDGTWNSTFPNSNDNHAGTLRGAVAGSTLSVLLKPIGGSTCQYGPFELTATVTSAGSMSGTLTEAYPCVVANSGSFSGAKQ